MTVDTISASFDEDADGPVAWLDCPDGLFACRVMRPSGAGIDTSKASVPYKADTHFWILYPAKLNLREGFGGSAVLTKDGLPLGIVRAMDTQNCAALCVFVHEILDRVARHVPNGERLRICKAATRQRTAATSESNLVRASGKTIVIDVVFARGEVYMMSSKSSRMVVS